jgi:hypothetical protein
MNDPELRERIGKAAALTAAKYTWDENARELHTVIEMLLSGKETPSAMPAENHERPRG